MPQTIAHLLRAAAQSSPEQIVYRFYTESGVIATNLSFGYVHVKAAALARHLRSLGSPQDRVLVFCNPGLQCIVDIFACFYAGFIAVPVPPISGTRGDLRTQNIALDAGARLALGAIKKHNSHFRTLADGTIHVVDAPSEVDPCGPCDWDLDTREDSIAVLQYTSGSTGNPKGVMLTHENLVSNGAHIEKAFDVSNSDHSVLWLPIYHDMGLMGGVLQSVYSRFPTTFIAPSAFMNRPLRWLEAISDYRATIAGGPDFGYALCSRMGKHSAAHRLDLSSWRVAFNGSELVRSETVTDFARTFAPAGFNISAFRPCYGLAEATLLVSASRFSADSLVTVDLDALNHGRVVSREDTPGAVRCVVSLGRPEPGHQVCIVDPVSGRCLDENAIGEICFSGPSVGRGYWNRPEDTRRTFQAQLPEQPGRNYLQTGDLGFLRGSQLFLTGRAKELIIIRGRNYYPQDIEKSAENLHSTFRPDHCAAFSIDVDGEERLVVVQEVERGQRHADLPGGIVALVQRIVEEHGVTPHDVVLIRTGTLPKTTSGKIQRLACRDAYLRGDLKVIASSQSALETASAGVAGDGQHEPDQPPPHATLFQEVFGRSVTAANANARLSTLGLDSLKALELKMFLEERTGREFNLVQLLESTVGDLLSMFESAPKTVAEVAARDDEPKRQGVRSNQDTLYPLSVGQKALWFLQQLEPESASLVISRQIRISGSLNVTRLRSCFNAVLARHPSLRLTVTHKDAEIVQIISDENEAWIEEHDARNWSESELALQIDQRSREPIDLAVGPVFRAHVYVRSESESRLLLRVHHIAVDLLSLCVVVDEVAELYGAGPNSAPPHRPDIAADYRDFVNWQYGMIASSAGEKRLSYWLTRLKGLTPSLHPGFQRRIPDGAGQALAHRFSLNKALVKHVKDFAQAHQATLYSVLLAAFEVFLYRHSNNPDYALGILSSGRARRCWKNTVGYFVNPVVIRPSIDGSETFERYFERSRAALLDALENSDLPFAHLVEHLKVGKREQAHRFIDVMCMLQPSSSTGGRDLSSFALGAAGSAFRVGDLIFESVESNYDGLQFDLVFAAAESGDSIKAVFHYDSARYEPARIAEFARDYETFLEIAISRPGELVDRLPLLGEERVGRLRAWNDTDAAVPELCIHQVFEQQAERTPEEIAVVCDANELSYADLDARANQLAHYLLTFGVQPETSVGVYLDRSIEMVVALLAVLKAGGAYVPLDLALPAERRQDILERSGVGIVLTSGVYGRELPERPGLCIIRLDAAAKAISSAPTERVNVRVLADNLAYVMHTSGSTGVPKGVMISHRNVINFFQAMNHKVPCGPGDTLFAVTNIAFDISVLELLWTLSRGCRVVVIHDLASPIQPSRRTPRAAALRFSLFYFASSANNGESSPYQLLFDGARLADELDFEAVWTPERHFHAFGGSFPNPSVTSAALAAITKRLSIRAGSVVLPLQNPIRVAEEWSVVDNLSNGRVGVAIASGWHADDFVFFPENYSERRQIMLEQIRMLRSLWLGDSVAVKNGSGNSIEIKIYPRPVQAVLPIWLTSGGSKETFVSAAQLGANVLTHLLGQRIPDVAENIALYRRQVEAEGRDSVEGTVTLMLHTCIGDTRAGVRTEAHEPFKRYLDSSVGLIANLVRGLKLDIDIAGLNQKDRDDLLTFAADRYMSTSGLFGTRESVITLLEEIAEIGVNEIGCLIDFGIPLKSFLRTIRYLADIRDRLQKTHEPADYSFTAQAARYPPTLMQCTPSLLRTLVTDRKSLAAIGGLRTLMLGGEPVPLPLVKQCAETGVKTILDMYGPTESTIWSSVLPIDPSEDSVFIGGPIANTQIYVLNNELAPVPCGVVGELYIGGLGLARGYLANPALTAERFIPDPLTGKRGARLYRTGDLGRRLEDGRIELVGRSDQQVKVRGHRIELGDIEASLNLAPGVQSGFAKKITTASSDERLAAFIVPLAERRLEIAAVREFLKTKLPHYMLPNDFYIIDSVPLTANGKVDRKRLEAPATQRTLPSPDIASAQTGLESDIAGIWKQVLGIDTFSIDDNFFDIGGHSLLMVQVHQKAQERLSREFPLLIMLQYPTIRSLCSYLQGAGGPALDLGRDTATKQKAALRQHREKALAARQGS